MEKLLGGFILLVEEVIVLGTRGRHWESIMGGGRPHPLLALKGFHVAKFVIGVLLTQGPSMSLQAWLNSGDSMTSF